MKNYLKLLIVTFFVSMGVGQANADDQFAYCTDIKTLAETVMSARQNNADISQMLTAAGNSYTGENTQADENAHAILIALIKDAWQVPAWSGDVYQQRAIKQFGNEAFIACYLK